MSRIVVLGAGPAGLAAAYQLATRGFDVTVIERSAVVGGNAGSFELDGLRVDYGSHRLHPACPRPILDDIRAMLRADLLDRPRHGRIRLHGRWLHFPLKPADLMLHVTPQFALGVLADMAVTPARRNRVETFASVLEQNLGRTICREFYFPYAEKIWGLPAEDLAVEQARRRVAAGSLAKMARRVLSAIPGLKPAGSGRFFYPRKGYGQISEAYYEAATRAGADVHLGESLQRVEVDRHRASAVVTSAASGEPRYRATQVLSTIPLPVLARAITPEAPAGVLHAADALRYRSMILIYLVLDADRFTEFDAHYFPGKDVPITRLSEPKNYGLTNLAGTTALCAELPCAVGDASWVAGDDELAAMLVDALAKVGLRVSARVRRVVTRRLTHAYPIYTRTYQADFDVVDRFVASVEGIVTFGRQGLFAHDNTHHTLAMAYAANDCLDDEGRLDRAKWADARRSFESHVVED
ncbi:MAG: FAD-dependent oxidoreductase [Acidobacteria bacterium]|nr:FAD-dependent oxidoreductase [Acidobacteriota bacterium]